MEYSIAHSQMNIVGQHLFPDGRVAWEDAIAPDIQRGERYWTGRLRHCSYCGSIHPTDVVNAIRAGAKGEWADWKYGVPHKAYFDVPNPHAGMLEIRGHANYLVKGWVAMENGHSHAPPEPASSTDHAKFYVVHLKDAAPEEKEIIEQHLGIRFEFLDNDKIRWSRVS